MDFELLKNRSTQEIEEPCNTPEVESVLPIDPEAFAFAYSGFIT